MKAKINRIVSDLRCAVGYWFISMGAAITDASVVSVMGKWDFKRKSKLPRRTAEVRTAS